ncbi:MAG: type IV pilin protein [Rhodanobacteraceae bacterium]|nr:type IV pilin protein [Rhodanobacteraceae bacterium]MBL0042502.1 type IV pilin protein [Xanthomonadales bacterium]MBP6077252.1 type IV pilin protein [Xanthomonadales bacterium]MBP7623325.1 type IV pilin protein [Xanthomonadales bacterium]
MHAARGFTLIELMVTVAVVAILATIAMPSYQEQIRKTRRADARQELMRFATAQERFYTNCNRYASTLNGAQSTCSGLGAASASINSENGYYSLSLAGDGSAYTLTATAQNGQEADTKCGNLSLTDAGVKGATGTLGAAECW